MFENCVPDPHQEMKFKLNGILVFAAYWFSKHILKFLKNKEFNDIKNTSKYTAFAMVWATLCASGGGNALVL